MINKFLNFINTSVTAFHAAQNIEKILLANNYIKLNESNKWKLELGKNYYFTRNNSSVMAIKMPKENNDLSFNITATHLDSPTFKIKPNYNMENGSYIELNTEIYGSPIQNTWMDRPLGVAGRVIVNNKCGLETKLVNLNEGICMIPNCPIHYLQINEGIKLNPQIELIPLAGEKGSADLYDLISNKLNIKKEDIVSTDLYLTNLDRGMLVGINKEFIMAPQIDNLECTYGALEALLNSNQPNNSINILAMFDNEEIGSGTRQGAASPLLSDTLKRISYSLGKDEEDLRTILASSFMVSADNAHAYHPNYPSKYDPTNKVFMNKGVVIKNAARGSYTTDAISLAYFKKICENADAMYQLNTNRSDIPGGSTLGRIALGSVSISSVDIGLAQLAMHSSYETAGSKDLEELYKALKKFYETHLVVKEDGILCF